MRPTWLKAAGGQHSPTRCLRRACRPQCVSPRRGTLREAPLSVLRGDVNVGVAERGPVLQVDGANFVILRRLLLA